MTIVHVIPPEERDRAVTAGSHLHSLETHGQVSQSRLPRSVLRVRYETWWILIHLTYLIHSVHDFQEQLALIPSVHSLCERLAYQLKYDQVAEDKRSRLQPQV